MSGYGPLAEHKNDIDGIPVWTVSALVNRSEEASQMETFTLIASAKLAENIGKFGELTPIKLHGLAGGKWVQRAGNKNLVLQITGVEANSLHTAVFPHQFTSQSPRDIRHRISPIENLLTDDTKFKDCLCSD